jgi:hypothetical protein
VVGESQQAPQERKAHRAAVQNIGEVESDESDNPGPSPDNGSGGGNSQDEISDQIVQEVESWKVEAQERRLQAMKDVPAAELVWWGSMATPAGTPDFRGNSSSCTEPLLYFSSFGHHS